MVEYIENKLDTFQTILFQTSRHIINANNGADGNLGIKITFHVILINRPKKWI